MPLTWRQKDLELVQKSQLLSQSKNHLTRILTNSSLGFEEYIREEHRAGQYSLTGLKLQAWAKRLFWFGPPSAYLLREMLDWVCTF